jgi:tetratricopeptide (TPR) repeat protein
MDKKTRQSILNTFREVIHEEGFLLTGHTEIQDLDKSDWVAVQYSGTSVYRPRLKSKKYQESQPVELQPVKDLPFKKEEKKVGFNRPVIKPSRVVAKESIKKAATSQRVTEKTDNEPNMQVGDYFKRAYNFAMSDKESDALELIEQLIKKDPLFSEAYYLRAILSRNRDQSRADLQKLLYLQPNHLMGNIELASLHESAGDKEKSQRLFKNAMQILNNEQQVSENILYGEENLESLHSLLKVKLGS